MRIRRRVCEAEGVLALGSGGDSGVPLAIDRGIWRIVVRSVAESGAKPPFAYAFWLNLKCIFVLEGSGLLLCDFTVVKRHYIVCNYRFRRFFK
jgi:hypothetical protein